MSLQFKDIVIFELLCMSTRLVIACLLIYRHFKIQNTRKSKTGVISLLIDKVEIMFLLESRKKE